MSRLDFPGRCCIFIYGKVEGLAMLFLLRSFETLQSMPIDTDVYRAKLVRE